MTTIQQKAVKVINTRLRALRTALQQACESGMQSASISQGGSSQSYSRMSVTDIRKEIARLEQDKQAILGGGAYRILGPDFRYILGR